MIIGRELVEKHYSEIEESERLYSTGDSELDELLERAFCEGYEYAQREFAAYKPPFSQEQYRKAIKLANENGIKGRSIGVVGKRAVEYLKKESGLSTNQLRQEIQQAMISKQNNPTGGHPNRAARITKSGAQMIKKYLNFNLFDLTSHTVAEIRRYCSIEGMRAKILNILEN